MTDNAGSGNGQPGTGGTPPAGTGASTPFYSGFGDTELRGYMETKGFKDPEALAGAYRNFEKLQGVPQDRLLRLPDKVDDPAWGGIYDKLGRPAKPEDYGLKGDEGLVKRMSPVLHKHGASSALAQALNAEWDAHVDELIKADTEQRQQRDATEMQALRTGWGGEFDKNSELARRASREFGLTEQQFNDVSNTLGSKATLELFHKIGAKLGEAAPFDPHGAGGNGGFGTSPDAAKQRIAALKADQGWVAKYLQGDVAARDEMDRLQKIAYGG